MKHRSTPAFTVIEVVLVLAIAGLIFIIVFLALPALQRMSRDNQRVQAAQQVLALLDRFKANTGHYPFTASDQTAFSSNYKIDFVDPATGNPYAIEYSMTLFDTHDVTAVNDKIFYATGHWCSPGGANMVDGDDITKTIVVVIARKEIGNYYCIDNRGGGD